MRRCTKPSHPAPADHGGQCPRVETVVGRRKANRAHIVVRLHPLVQGEDGEVVPVAFTRLVVEVVDQAEEFRMAENSFCGKSLNVPVLVSVVIDPKSNL